MKEIIDLQARVLAHAPLLAEGDGIDIGRDEVGGEVELLSDELRAEAEALRQAINAAVPEDFDYFAFVAGDEGPHFGLDRDGRPFGSEEEEWDPERSLLEQLRAFDWDATRAQAKESHALAEAMSILRRITGPLPSAKSLQRDHREEVKDFVREKRRDAGKVHVLYLHAAEGLMQVAFEDGDAFREMLPGMFGRGDDVVAIVANGKPLPVERIDAHKAQAQRTLKERMREQSEEAARQREAKSSTGAEAGGGDLPG